MENAHADVCIVGAGIAGITTAYLLAKEGKSVIVLDDGVVGGGQTQRTTAHLSNALDERYFDIEWLHGVEGAKLAASSHTAAIDRIESIIGDEQIACDFVRLDGYLILPPGESPELLDRERLPLPSELGSATSSFSRTRRYCTSIRDLVCDFPTRRNSTRSCT